MKMLRLFTCVAICAAVLGGTTSAQATLALKLAEIHEAGFPTTQGDEEFARLVTERSQGRIVITVYPSGQLGEETPVIQKVQTGDIDFARISLSPMAQSAPELNVLTLPYIYTDSVQMWKVLQGPIGAEMLKSVEKAGMVGLNFLDAGSRNFYTTKKQIKSVADLKGLKIRIQDNKLMRDMMGLLGAAGIPMATGDIYSALQTGTVDGAENNVPSYVGFSHHEVAKYFIADGHTRVPEITVVSKALFDTLSKADQDLIKKAAADAVEFQKAKWADSEKSYADKAKAAGTVFYTPDAKAIAEFQKAVEPIYKDYAKFSDLIQRIRNTK
jgi:tripartite ATP-independent transporter DctP family solute receptor